jgi:hypothetical protein
MIQTLLKKNKHVWLLAGMIIGVVVLQIIPARHHSTVRSTSSIPGDFKKPAWQAEYRLDENKNAILQERSDFADELLAQHRTDAIYDITLGDDTKDPWCVTFT